MKKRYLLLFILFMAVGAFTSRETAAQVDAHFSQYYAYPLWLNPGLTGVMDGDFRISANYRRQWAGIATPYSTKALSFDTRSIKHLSFGGTVLNQSVGDAGYNYINALASAAYSAILDNDRMNVVSIGLQAGVISRRFDPAKLQSGSQWSAALGFDPGTPSGEMFDKTASSTFDVNAGIFYYNKNPYAFVNPFIGVSLYHLFTPYDPFLGNSAERLPMRLNIHGGLKIKLNTLFNLTPQLLYLRQGTAYEMAGSVYAQYILSDNSDFLFGAVYRHRDAIIPFAGFHVGDFTIGLSYDVNVSGLKRAALSNGGYEISFSFINHKNLEKRHLTCPRF